MDSRFTTLALYALGAGAADDIAGQAEDPPGAVEGQAPLAVRPFPDGAPDRGAGAVLRIRRAAASSAPTIAPDDVAAAARGRLHAAVRSSTASAIAKTARRDRRDHGRHLRPAVHRRLSRAVPVQPLRARASARPAPSCSRRRGVTVTDLDGNRFYDLTGSYGVNVFGYDFYKECIERGAARVARSRPGARPLSSGDRLQRRSGCGRFPASTKCRSTCPAPRR